ncbi:hypothetical protein GQ457_03G005280 [Hibiscus cannabinus]
MASYSPPEFRIIWLDTIPLCRTAPVDKTISTRAFNADEGVQLTSTTFLEYCACYSFFHDIINRGEQLCVRFINLASGLAESLGACVEVKVSDEQLAVLLSDL